MGFRMASEIISLQHRRRGRKIVESAKMILQLFHGLSELLKATTPMLVVEKRGEEFGSITEFLGVLADLVPLGVSAVLQRLCVFLDFLPKAVECVRGEF
jgi:hypothetical protein